MIKFTRRTVGKTEFDKFTAHFSEGVRVKNHVLYFSIQNHYGRFFTYVMNPVSNKWDGLSTCNPMFGANTFGPHKALNVAVSELSAWLARVGSELRYPTA